MQPEDKYLVTSDFRDRKRGEGTLKTTDLRRVTSSTVDNEDAAVAVSVCVRSLG